MRCRSTFRNTVVSTFCVILFMSSASAYDGPVGVTFRAPFIEKGDINTVVLEGISVRAKVRIDNTWSVETDGKGRAFPSQFIATIADSEITFGLHNQDKGAIATNILIPFDGSDTNGTGFKEPLSITASSGNRQARIFRGPELARGMMKLRSFRVPVKIPAESTVELKIIVSHPLAVNPAWYQFICTDSHARFPSYQSLTTDGCRLEFELDSPEDQSKTNDLKFQWKKTFHNEPITEQKHQSIKFKTESIEWVRVFR